MKIQITGKELQASMATVGAVLGKAAFAFPTYAKFKVDVGNVVMKAQNDGVISFTPEADGGVSIEINPEIMVKTMQLLTPVYLGMVDVAKEYMGVAKIAESAMKDIAAVESEARRVYADGQLTLEEIEARTKAQEIAAKVNTPTDSSTWTPIFRHQMARELRILEEADAKAAE